MRVPLSQDGGSLSAEVAFWHRFNMQKRARHTFNRFFFSAGLLLSDRQGATEIEMKSRKPTPSPLLSM